MSPALVSPRCAYVVEVCGGEGNRILRVPEGVRLEEVGRVEDLIPADLERREASRAASPRAVSKDDAEQGRVFGPLSGKMVSLRRFAREAGYSPRTFYRWIQQGKFRREHGVRRSGSGSIRIDYSRALRALKNGEFPSNAPLRNVHKRGVPYASEER